MTVPESAAPPIVTIDGERIALGPERRDLLPLVQRWHNDFTALRSLGDPPVPQTLEQASAEYDHHATIPEMVRFLIYERATWRPIGLTLLHDIEYRQGTCLGYLGHPHGSSALSRSARGAIRSVESGVAA